jgi:F420-0:gamma-glutamyl ligase-like protein
MQVRYQAVKSTYWRPGDDYVARILAALNQRLQDGDILVVSEKAISIAKGNIVSEAGVKPSCLACILTRFWMRVVWGCLLGYLCRFRHETLKRLKTYPLEKGSCHKQVVLDHAGFFHALNYGSEGGIDISNLPYAYACLPLKAPIAEADLIRDRVLGATRKRVTVIIADTDSTFSFRNFHVTSRPQAIEGIQSLRSPLPFLAGRALKLKQRATPVAVAGQTMSVEDALRFSDIAHHARGSGAGRTIWDGAETFGVGLSEITWEMLETINHYPVVLIRRETP